VEPGLDLLVCRCGWRHQRMTATHQIIPNRLSRHHFFAFGGTMASLATLATRNLTTFFAGILMASPVAGFVSVRGITS